MLSAFNPRLSSFFVVYRSGLTGTVNTDARTRRNDARLFIFEREIAAGETTARFQVSVLAAHSRIVGDGVQTARVLSVCERPEEPVISVQNGQRGVPQGISTSLF